MKLNRSQLRSLSRELHNFVFHFNDTLGLAPKRASYCKAYLSGLMLNGERKSLYPICERLNKEKEYNNLQQFLTDSPWNEDELLKSIRKYTFEKLKIKSEGVLILDDTSFPKKGSHSVGVSRQYCGSLGKIANCQSLVSLHYSSGPIHIPLQRKLYLPKDWTEDRKRMEKAKVPEERQVFYPKWQMALQALDEVKEEVNFESFVFDAGYGNNRIFLEELDKREIPFIGQIREESQFWLKGIPLNPDKNRRGRPRKYLHIRDSKETTKTAKQIAEDSFSDKKNIKRCLLSTKKEIEYIHLEVYEKRGRGKRELGPLRRLLIERSGSVYKYFISDRVKFNSSEKLIRLAHRRWEIEQGYQQLKEELGMDHYEGRSWRGFHHHVTLCFMAFCFLQILRRKKKRDSLFLKFENT